MKDLIEFLLECMVTYVCEVIFEAKRFVNNLQAMTKYYKP